MKKLMATLLTLVMVMGISVSVFAYNDPTAYGNYGYNYYGYNNYGYYNCTGMRQTYSDEEYNPSSWFDTYVEEYGVVFHLYPTMPITRSDVFAPIGKAMERAYEDNGRTFTNNYGVPFVDFTWSPELATVAGGLYQRGIMSGYSEDNTVRLMNNITRAELAKVLVTTAKQNGIYSGYNNINSTFTDIEDSWAKQYINECNAMGLLYGKSATIFAPNDLVTYEEYVAIMIRMAERTNSTYSFDIEDIAFGISDTMDIDFEEVEVEDDFTLSVYGSKTVYMTVGETETITVKVSPSDVEVSKSDVNWETNKSGYLKLSNDYVENDRYVKIPVKALKEGKVTLTAVASNDDDVTADFTIVISEEEYEEDDIYVTSISLNPSSVTLEIGESRTITATVSPSNATNKDITWESYNTSVATVDQNGKITARGAGNTKVAATANDGSGIVKTIDVTVNDAVVTPKDVYVTSISLNPSSVNLEVGESKNITATVSPSNATNKGVTWKSNNTLVATVDQNGRITAKGVGNTTVTATANDGSGIVATIDVTVEAEEIVVVDNVKPEVQTTGAIVIKRDEIATITVTAFDENLKSFTLKKSDILGMTGAGVSVNDIVKISDTQYQVKLLGVETAIGEVCIAAGVAVDEAGNLSDETDGIVIKVLALD